MNKQQSTPVQNDNNDVSTVGTSSSTDYPIQQLVTTINDTSIAIPAILIDLSHDDDDDDDENDDNCSGVCESPLKRCRHDYLLRSTTNDYSRTIADCSSDSYEEEEDYDDEIEVIEAPTIPEIVTSEVEQNDNENNEVEFIGIRNVTSYQLLPHIRSHCPTFAFPPLSMMMTTTTTTTCIPVNTKDLDSDSSTSTKMDMNTDNNPTTNVIDYIEKNYCSLCYCLVCDTTVQYCNDWHIHCTATDVGPFKEYWLEQRQQQQQKKVSTTDKFNTTTHNIEGNSLLLS